MALISLATSCSTDAIEETTTESHYLVDINLAMETDWVMADEILLLINEHRTSIGLSELKRDQQYASAYAVDHTKYMIDKDKISHDNFNDRARALKEKGAQTVAENVAYGYDTAEKAVTAWLNSPSHRNIIEGPYTNSGFGVLTNEDGRYFYTQIFYRK